MTTNYPAYFRDVSHLDAIDIYRILAMWQIDSPPLQHAIKKLLAAGKRGAKDDAKDVQEAIDSLQRWQAMRAEDELQHYKTTVTPRPEVPHHVPRHTRHEIAQALQFPTIDPFGVMHCSHGAGRQEVKP